MRYLLDTNIFVFMTLDPDSLSNDVLMALNEPDSLLFISAESVKELVVAYKKKRLGTKISHAITEQMTLVSSDTRFPFYRRQGLKLLYNER